MIGDTAPLERETALLAIASTMTADGHFTETVNVLSWVVREHPKPEMVREVIVQTHLFAGYPRTLNALEALRQGAEKAGVDISGLRAEPSEPAITNEQVIERANNLWGRVYGDNAAKVAANAKKLSPDLALWSQIVGYGRVLSRPEPDALTREFCVVAALIPMDVQPQLKGHVAGVLNLGGTADQLWQLLSIVKKLLDAPKVLDAAQRTFEAVLGKKASDLSLEDEQKYKWL